MKSKIRIKTGPLGAFISCKLEKSEDLVDEVLALFKEKFGFRSEWCRVVFHDNGEFHIIPVEPHQLEDQAEKMKQAAS